MELRLSKEELVLVVMSLIKMEREVLEELPSGSDELCGVTDKFIGLLYGGTPEINQLVVDLQQATDELTVNRCVIPDRVQRLRMVELSRSSL